MPLVETHVDFQDRFTEITREVSGLALRAVDAGAKEGAAAASAVASTRSKTGNMAAIRIEPARATFDGFVASFVSPTYYSWFQSLGTLGNRKRRLKQAPRTDRTREPGTGIKPLGFLDAGRRAGRAAMKRVIERGL